MNMWVEVRAKSGRSSAKGPGTSIVAADLFEETPFTPPVRAAPISAAWRGRRRRRRRRADSPTTRWREPTRRWRDGTRSRSTTTTGPRRRGGVWIRLDHTDSNQHVNSIVYPRLSRSPRCGGYAETAGAAKCSCATSTCVSQASFAGDRVRRTCARSRSVNSAPASPAYLAQTGRPVRAERRGSCSDEETRLAVAWRVGSIRGGTFTDCVGVSPDGRARSQGGCRRRRAGDPASARCSGSRPATTSRPATCAWARPSPQRAARAARRDNALRSSVAVRRICFAIGDQTGTSCSRWEREADAAAGDRREAGGARQHRRAEILFADDRGA